jgi:hypothetical protein
MTTATNPTDKPSRQPILGRDDKGRFIYGNPGGPGNPFARQTAALRSALIRRLTVEQIEGIADKLIELALAGDVAAAKLVLQYGIGKPTEAIDPDQVDRLEWERERQQFVPAAEVNAISQGMSVAFAAFVSSLTRACQTSELAEQLSQNLDLKNKADAEHARSAPEQDQVKPADEPCSSTTPAPVAEPTNPQVIPIPGSVNKREKQATRSANRRQSATSPRQQTGVSAKLSARPIAEEEPAEAGHPVADSVMVRHWHTDRPPSANDPNRSNGSG